MIQPSPKDILPIDWREEEEETQSALMNEELRGPYPESRALALCQPALRRHPLPVGRFYGVAGRRMPG